MLLVWLGSMVGLIAVWKMRFCIGFCGGVGICLLVVGVNALERSKK